MLGGYCRVTVADYVQQCHDNRRWSCIGSKRRICRWSRSTLYTLIAHRGERGLLALRVQSDRRNIGGKSRRLDRAKNRIRSVLTEKDLPEQLLDCTTTLAITANPSPLKHLPSSPRERLNHIRATTAPSQCSAELSGRAPARLVRCRRAAGLRRYVHPYIVATELQWCIKRVANASMASILAADSSSSDG